MKGKNVRLEAFRDEAGNWRWHLIAANGQIVATSGEAFDSQHNAVRAAANTKRLMGLVQRISVEAQVPVEV